MDDLERRILTLELQAKHETDRNQWQLNDLHGRVSKLENQPDTMTRISAYGGLIKILIAIAIPVLVLLATGDLRQALKLARLGG